MKQSLSATKCSCQAKLKLASCKLLAAKDASAAAGNRQASPASPATTASLASSSSSVAAASVAASVKISDQLASSDQNEFIKILIVNGGASSGSQQAKKYYPATSCDQQKLEQTFGEPKLHNTQADSRCSSGISCNSNWPPKSVSRQLCEFHQHQLHHQHHQQQQPCRSLSRRGSSASSDSGSSYKCDSTAKYTTCPAKLEQLKVVESNKLRLAKRLDWQEQQQQDSSSEKGRLIKLASMMAKSSEENANIYQQIEPASRGSRLLSRSGSQCSSVSSSSLMSSSSDRSGCSAQCRPRIDEESSVEEISETSQDELDDNNNNCEDFPDAYASQESPMKAVRESSPTVAPPPPPPPPPPPLPPMLPAKQSAVSHDQELQLKARQLAEDNSDTAGRSSNSSGLKRPTNNLPAFIPPQFSAPPEDGTNIKPSEYLKRMTSGSKSSASCTPIGSLSSSSGASLASARSENCSSNDAQPERRFERNLNVVNNNAKFRRPLNELNRSQSTSALNAELDSSGSHFADAVDDEPARAELKVNLMSAIQNFDRSKFAKVDSQLRPASGEVARADNLLAATKRDLIAELKDAKGLDGIKRMKETGKGSKQALANLMPDFKPQDFLEKVAESEPNAPMWRRQMLAKKAAERARQDCQEKLRVELEQRRLSQVPAWKRQMLARKAADRCKRDELDKARREADQRRAVSSKLPAWQLQLARAKMNSASTGNVSELGLLH